MQVVGFNKVFREFNRSTARYRIAKGSAGSGKSVNIAQDYILKLSDPKYQGANLLVVRGTEASHKDSTYAELCKAINHMELARYWEIRTAPLELYNKVTGNGIIFRGFNDERARERVKSITFRSGELTWIWCEEATDLREADVDILDDRLRGVLDNPSLFYQMTFSFNPVSAQHWIKRRFWDWETPEVHKCHSTYLDNRFIDAAYHTRMLRRKEVDPDGYKVYGLGEWGELGGLILTNYVIEELSKNPADYDTVLYAQDFGYNHANCILDVGFKDEDIYVLDEIYVFEKDTAEIIELAEAKGLDHGRLMYCDSAEPDRIKMWKKAGYKALAVKKEPGSVNAQIDYLKQRRIHINGCCLGTLNEIKKWKWIKDEKTGLYLDKPVPLEDDAMAALRYSIELVRRRNRLKTMNKSALGL